MSVARLLISLFLDLINNGYSGGKNKLWISGLFFIILFIKILSTPEILYGYNALYKKIKELKFLTEQFELKAENLKMPATYGRLPEF